MKKYIISIIMLCFVFCTNAQNNGDVQRLVKEGIVLHDKGDYSGAIKKYDEALSVDKEYIDAYYEKGYSLYASGQIKECATLSKYVIKKFPDHPLLKAVFIQYASALDDLGRSKDALEVYDEGISKFPDEYLLYFNKGLTLQKLEKYDEALIQYQNSLKLKPLHSSSNYYTGILLQKPNRIPALLAYCTFLAIETNTKRSKDAFVRIKEIMGMNVKKEGSNTTIYLDPSILDKDKKKNAENDFSSVEFAFTFMALTGDAKGIDSIAKTPADKFSFKFQLLINSLLNSKKDNKGFYWDHYVPFFAEMKEKDLVGTLAHLVFLSTDDEGNKSWVEKNESSIDDFYEWLKNYKWN